MIIDTETHVIFRMCFKQANPEKSLIEPWTWHEMGGDLLVAEMDRAGVDKAFLVSYGYGNLVLAMNNWGLEGEDFISGKKYAYQYYKKYPDRLFWFLTLPDPRREDILEVIKKDFELGAGGIKIFPALINMNLNDSKLMDIFRLARDHKKVIMLGVEETMPPQTPTLEALLSQLDEVLQEFPDQHFQLNHAGCLDPLHADAKIVFDLARNHRNLFLSTAILGYIYNSSQEGFDGHEYPFPNQLKRLRRLYEEVGPDNIMFATDWPWLEQYRKYVQDVDAVRRHADFMTDQDKEKFLGLNALRYLG
jgi:predicted TIM-barrel fold metal-dependent hydrolase